MCVCVCVCVCGSSGGARAAVAATPGSDRVCVGLPNCTSAQCVRALCPRAHGVPLTARRRYAVAPHGQPHMRGCAPLTACGGGAHETLAPTRASDRACTMSAWVWVGVTIAVCVVFGACGVCAWRRAHGKGYTNTRHGEGAGVVSTADEEERAAATAQAAAAVEHETAGLRGRDATAVPTAV